MSSEAITDKENIASNEKKEDDGDNVQEENKVEKTVGDETGENVANEHHEGEGQEEDKVEKTDGDETGENVADEHHEGEQLESETLKENQDEDKIDEIVEGEENEEEGIKIKVEGEELDGDADQEQTKDEEGTEEVEGKELDVDAEQEEGMEEENAEEEKAEQEKAEEEHVEEIVEEEEPEYVEVPVDPAAPLDLTDSKDAMRADFELRPEQLAEVEKLWELFQDYTPAYTDIADYITVKELVYMLEALLIMTYTEDQLMELVTFVCRPPDDNGHITYEQFLRMVMIRLRDMDIEEELRLALRVLDPGKTGEVEADELREVLGKMGNKLPQKMLDEFIKEIDLSGEGKIGIEDVVAICGMDLRKDDIIMENTEPDEEAEEPT